MTKNRMALDKQKIGSTVEDGVYKNFIGIIKKTREISDGNRFGQHGELLSLANPEISNWKENVHGIRIG